jgi:hypothetical protein
MIGVVDRARHAHAVGEIFVLMRRLGLTLEDLIEVDGEDHEKAKLVEKCRSRMARLSVDFADLEQALPPIPKSQHEGGQQCR